MNTAGWRCPNCSEINGTAIYRCKNCHASRPPDGELTDGTGGSTSARGWRSACIILLIVVLMLVVAGLATAYRFLEGMSHI